MFNTSRSSNPSKKVFAKKNENKKGNSATVLGKSSPFKSLINSDDIAQPSLENAIIPLNLNILNESEGVLGVISPEFLMQTPLELSTLAIGPFQLAFQSNRKYQVHKTRKDIKEIIDQVSTWCDYQLKSLDQLTLQLRGSLTNSASITTNDLSLTFDLHSGSDMAEHSRKVRGLPATIDDKAVDKLRILAHRTHARYRNCIMLLTGGGSPDSMDFERVSESAQSLSSSASMYLEIMPKGDPKRLPLFAYHVYASCAKIDARCMRMVECGKGNRLDPSSRSHLENLLRQGASEVNDMWHASGGTMYAVGLVWAPMLARYALLGRAISLRLSGSSHPVTVKEGVYERAVWSGNVAWDDGLEDIRRLFWPGRNVSTNLGGSLCLETWGDLVWFAKWKEFTPLTSVDEIPFDIPIWGMLADLGAPAFAGDCLMESDKNALQRLVLFDETCRSASLRLEKEFDWAVSRGVKFEIHRGSLPRTLSLSQKGNGKESVHSSRLHLNRLFDRSRIGRDFRSMAWAKLDKINLEPRPSCSSSVFFDLPLDIDSMDQ